MHYRCVAVKNVIQFVRSKTWGVALKGSAIAIENVVPRHFNTS